jgi:hypothetical protein
MSDFIRNDFKFSVFRQYKLDEKILSIATNKTPVHHYLIKLFDEIVVPMEKELKKLMITF